MPKITTFLHDTTIQNLKEIKKNSGQSLSKIAAELIETGYKIKQHQEAQKSNPQAEKKAKLVDKHTEYLLRIMAIATDIFRCIRNEKSKYKEENIDRVLEQIAVNTQKYIEGFLGKNQ